MPGSTPGDGRVSVLFVITRMPLGGAPRVVMDLIRELVAMHYRVVLATGPAGEGEGSLMDRCRDLGVPISVVSALQRAIHPLKDAIALWHLFRLMRRERFDIVHTHLSKAGILGRIAARLARTPVIVHTYHGDGLEDYHGMRKRFLAGTERGVGKLTDGFTLVSEELKTRLGAYRIDFADRFRIIRNGIAPIEAMPARGAGPKRVGTIAIFRPVKRLELFIEMAARIRALRDDVVFEMAGGGLCEAELRALSARLGDPVRFLGICSDPASLMASCEVLVLCSDHEGMPIAPIEAMMLGVPVVATRVGGVPEIVEDGRTGVLVPPGDVDALTRAVLDLLDHPERRQCMGQAAQQRAFEQFTASRMAAQTAAFYGELLGAKTP